MAMSKALPGEDRTRFCRLSLVIVEELPLILQDVLHREVPPNLLLQMVNKHEKGLKHLRPHQIIQVNNAKASGYSAFDITLLYTLLRNYFKKSIQPPTKGWGKQKMPEQGQETEGDDIERIRLIRNKHNHSVMVSNSAISETEFNEKWGIIHAVCARMQTRLPHIQHHYVQMLEESKIRTIDSDMEETYIDKIKELAKEEMSVKTLLLQLVQEKDLTSKEKITIQARKDHKKDIVKSFTDVSIRIFNEMVDPTYRLTSKSDLEKLYKATKKFLKEHKKDIEDDQLQVLLKRLEEKIKAYANLDEKNRINILHKFLNFNLKMKKKYGASMFCSNGSIILSVTFSSKECYSHYKKDLERGIIGEEILQIILYPPYLASFDLTAEDLIVCLNDQELKEDNKGDKSAYSLSSGLETCANHPDQYYTLACQQCQLPVCVLCIEISEHKNHSFISLNVMLQEKLSWINNEIKRGHTFEEQMELEKTTLVKHISDIKLRMRVKHQSLKDELDDILKENVERLKRHQESHVDAIDKTLNDAEQHVSFLEKNLNEAAECQPAQALILLKSSSRSSLKKDLFKTYMVDKPSFVESGTEFTTISDIFGTLYPLSFKGTGSSDYEEELQKPGNEITIVDSLSNLTPMSKDSAIEIDDREDDITLVDEFTTTFVDTLRYGGVP